jgi:hypothetical protein
MKAISIRAPWWLAILEWGKRIENREWRAPIAYRGPVLIHASSWWRVDEIADNLLFCRDAIAETKRRYPTRAVACDRSWGHLEAYRGGIVGRANLVDCRWNGNSGDPWAQDAGSHGLKESYRETGALGLILADVEPLPFIPLKGALGLFEVTPESIMADARRAKDGPEHRVAAESLIKMLKEAA